jgi:hypothetical protein
VIQAAPGIPAGLSGPDRQDDTANGAAAIKPQVFITIPGLGVRAEALPGDARPYSDTDDAARVHDIQRVDSPLDRAHGFGGG